MPDRSTESVEELLDRYLSQGRMSTETTELDAYFSAHPARERAVRALFDALSRSGETPPDVVRAWAVMRTRIEQDLIGEIEPLANLPFFREGVSKRAKSAVWRGTEGWGFKAHPLPQTVWYTLTGLATAVAIFLVGWSGGVHHTGHAPTSASTYTTARGERANVTLPDGSTVALDVASRLDVPADYMTGSHTVHLVGEALFTVSHRNSTPFAVVAGSTVARVLGTSFMVRHYATDSTAMVAVREGRVAVSSTVIAANQLIEVSQNGAMRLAPADLSQFSFVTGVLTLHRTRLADAIPELNRWYNADIRLGDASLARQEINGKMNAGSLSNLTAILEGALDVRVVRDGRILTLLAR